MDGTLGTSYKLLTPELWSDCWETFSNFIHALGQC